MGPLRINRTYKVAAAGFEPAATRLKVRCSNQLSYAAFINSFIRLLGSIGNQTEERMVETKRMRVLRIEGFEPTRITPLVPKTSTSTNFAISANRNLT